MATFCHDFSHHTTKPGGYHLLRHVGVTRFVSHVLQLLSIRCTQRNLYLQLANLQRSINKNQIENRSFHDLVMLIGSAIFIDS